MCGTRFGFFSRLGRFWVLPVKEHQVVNLCWNCCQCYSAIILGDREVAFFGDWQQASFSPSIYGVLIMYIVAEIQQYLVEVIYFPNLCGFVQMFTFLANFLSLPWCSFLDFGFQWMVSAAVSLHANSKWLYFVLALFVRVVSCRAANLFFTLIIRCCVFQGCLLDVSSRMEKCCCSSFYFLEDSDVFGWRRHDGLTLR